jgi:hypothetical protein
MAATRAAQANNEALFSADAVSCLRWGKANFIHAIFKEEIVRGTFTI